MNLSLVLLTLLIFVCTNTGAQNSKNDKLIKDYYGDYEKKDWHTLEVILDDSFTFSSPAGGDHINLKTYKEKCWPNANNTKRFDLENVIIDSDDAFVTYNGWTNDDKLFRNTEYFKFKDGKIISNECFFGTGKNFLIINKMTVI